MNARFEFAEMGFVEQRRRERRVERRRSVGDGLAVERLGSLPAVRERLLRGEGRWFREETRRELLGAEGFVLLFDVVALFARLFA